MLVRKLETRSRLSPDDKAAILDLPVTVRRVSRSSYLLREGEPPTICSVLVDGFAFRQKLTSEGARQIVSIHMPGDALDFQALFLAVSDHNIQTLSNAEIAAVPSAAVRDLMAQRPAVGAAIQADVVVEASILREWLTNVGRRQAQPRLAHLLCEFATRIDAQGLRHGDSYELPMIQEQIGDALGLTSVHINRTLKAMESAGLIRRTGRSIAFPNIDALRAVAGFSPLYLHLGSQGV
ncbi:MAG: Crp/Fnr family transcriptional regulator [Janthinobacterium lividum]